ncbi:hypothetical protein B9Z55_009398 [Caenorhabditis nigoni]|uniref:NTF2-like domain-containing protein n=1 Tax=Caenorhabditis nigoni TaxID=1611254 RepID=A0A2G5URU6_9PELO|nr:hypothetical protein B9Z55_009398 [Caenorhabditis nigoni]
MRTALLLAALTTLCYGYIDLQFVVSDGSEVIAQRVLDELTDAVMARNRTAIGDCLSDTFGFSGKVRVLKKEEFIDYILRISKRITPKGTVMSTFGRSPPMIITHTDFNFIGKYRRVDFTPKNGLKGGGRYVISNILKDSDFDGYYELEKKEQGAVDFILSLMKAICFRDRDAVLSHMTDDFKLTACRGTYDRDRIADIYSGFRHPRLFKVWIESFEFVNGEDVKIKLHISEPVNHDIGILPRNPYTIDLHLKSVGGVYKTNLIEYHTECDWPGL